MGGDGVDPVDPVDFILAETMGKSLAEIRAMPNAEIVEWCAFLNYRHEMRKLHS